MNRARLYLWSLLHSGEHAGDVALLDIENETARDLGLANPEQRLCDMEGAIGLWAERSELPDAKTYVCGLREDNRMERLRQV